MKKSLPRSLKGRATWWFCSSQCHAYLSFAISTFRLNAPTTDCSRNGAFFSRFFAAPAGGSACKTVTEDPTRDGRVAPPPPPPICSNVVLADCITEPESDGITRLFLAIHLRKYSYDFVFGALLLDQSFCFYSGKRLSFILWDLRTNAGICRTRSSPMHWPMQLYLSRR